MARISPLTYFVLLATASWYTAVAAAAPRPVVLELYTSEGCSSCPPAELLVTELAARDDVLPLSFHVDYWNDLGWKDRYSLADATQRQRQYARSLRLTSVYTPQAVVDGSLDIVGSDRASVMRAISGSRQGVETTISNDHGVIQIAVGPATNEGPADVVLLAYLHQAITHIERGENSGRTLLESNIVRSFQNLGRLSGRGQVFQVKATSLPDDTTHIAVLIQGANQGPILGATAQAIR